MSAKSLTYLKPMPILTSLLLLTTPAWSQSGGGSDLSRFNRCDAFYCPSGGGAASVQESVRQETGMGLPSTAGGSGSVSRAVVQPLNLSQPTAQAVRPSVGPLSPSVGGSSGGGLGNGGEPSSQAPSESGGQSPAGSSPSSASSGQGAAGGSDYASSSINGLGGGGGTSYAQNSNNVHGGYLYSNDEAPKSNSQNSQKSQSSQGMAAVQQNRLMNNMNPTSASTGKGSSSNTGQNSALASASGSGSGGFAAGGAYGSSGAAARQAASTQTGGDGILSRIAKNLGLDQFFSASGRGSAAAKAAALAAARAQAAAQARGANSPLADPKTILQRQFDEMRRRNLASQLEFAPAGSSIFKSMCEHYQTYARRNHLPESQIPCRE